MKKIQINYNSKLAFVADVLTDAYLLAVVLCNIPWKALVTQS